MRRKQGFLVGTTFVIFLMVTTSQVESVGEEEGSLFEFAQSLLQESVRNQNGGSGLNILSGVVEGLMQLDGGKQLGDMLTKGGNSGAVDLITNLASMWQASKTKTGKSDEADGLVVQQGLNLDPSLLSSVVDLFSTLNKVSNDAENNNVDENNNDKHHVKMNKGKSAEDSPVNWDAILSVAGTMMSSMSNPRVSSGGLESFLSFLPVVMRSIGGQHNRHSSHSIPHHTHSQFLPPFLENLHEYWDYFVQSEFGKGLWESSGLKDLVNSFTDDKGNVQTDKIFQSLENNAFRRQWIKGLSSFIAEWLKHLTNPEVQKSYLETGQIVCNSFLKAQGYPKDSLLDLRNPAKSISALTNAILKRHFDLSISSEAYVGPAVAYIQELVKAGHQTGFSLFKSSSGDAEAKLTESMDAEVIDPILRVHRAYKFALKRPGCAKYVFCTVNQGGQFVKYALKPAVTKASSFVASWFLSHNDSSVFWNLYTASTEESSCSKYNNNCADFDAEDLKATTEYYHNEL